jgi:hypothetical protein
VSYGLSVAPQNRLEDKDCVGHALRSGGKLYREASWARVSQSNLKTGGGITQIVHVASSWRSLGDDANDR